jgi:hypothetical protein
LASSLYIHNVLLVTVKKKKKEAPGASTLSALRFYAACARATRRERKFSIISGVNKITRGVGLYVSI